MTERAKKIMKAYEAEIKVLQKKLELLKEIETHKSQPRMEFDFGGKFDGGKFEVVSYNDEVYYRLEFPDESLEFPDESHNWFKKKYTVDGMMLVHIIDGETYRLLDGLWFLMKKEEK